MKTNAIRAEAKQLMRQSESLESKLKEVKKKNKAVKEDIKERRIHLEKINRYDKFTSLQLLMLQCREKSDPNLRRVQISESDLPKIQRTIPTPPFPSSPKESKETHEDNKIRRTVCLRNFFISYSQLFTAH